MSVKLVKNKQIKGEGLENKSTFLPKLNFETRHRSMPSSTTDDMIKYKNGDKSVDYKNRQTDNNNNDNENEVYKTQRSEIFHSSFSLNYDSKYNNSTDDGSSPMVARRKQHFLWKTEGEKKSRYGCGCFERYAFVTFLLH